MSTYTVYGNIVGPGQISSSKTFTFTSTSEPPVPSSGLFSRYRVVFGNKNRFSYRIPQDNIISKVDIFDMGKFYYKSNVQVDLWLNYSGAWYQHETGYTDRYGKVYITHTTDNIPNIRNCLGLARATIGGKTYNSNLVRFNFLPVSGYA